MKRAICLLLVCFGFMTAAKHGSAQQQPLTEEEAFQLGVDATSTGTRSGDGLHSTSVDKRSRARGKAAPSGGFAHWRSFLTRRCALRAPI